MTRTDALKSVIASLNAELAALRAFDVDALAAATQAKDGVLGQLQDVRADEMTDELRALAAEAQQLNETARVYVNLMAANVRRQLDQLTGAPAATYGRGGNVVPLRAA